MSKPVKNSLNGKVWIPVNGLKVSRFSVVPKIITCFLLYGLYCCIVIILLFCA